MSTVERVDLTEKPYNAKYITDPSQKELRELALKHAPSLMETAYGNINKITRLKARKAKLTYCLAPEAEKGDFSGPIIDPAKADFRLRPCQHRLRVTAHDPSGNRGRARRAGFRTRCRGAFGCDPRADRSGLRRCRRRRPDRAVALRR